MAVRWQAGWGGPRGATGKDPAALRRLLDATCYLRSDGDAAGARLYRGTDDEEAILAIEDDVIVVADSERRLLRALPAMRTEAG